MKCSLNLLFQSEHTQRKFQLFRMPKHYLGVLAAPQETSNQDSETTRRFHYECMKLKAGRGLQAHDLYNAPSLAENVHSNQILATPFVTALPRTLNIWLRDAGGQFTPADGSYLFPALNGKKSNVWDCRRTRFSIQGTPRQVASQRTGSHNIVSRRRQLFMSNALFDTHLKF